MKTASNMSTQIMKSFLLEEVKVALDKEKSVTHEQLSEKVENALTNDSSRKKISIPNNVSLLYRLSSGGY